MASVFETSTKTWSVKRTRSTGGSQAFNFGVVDGVRTLPNPIAVMTAPELVTGPAAGAVGANQVWSVDIAAVGQPDIAWVIVSSHWCLNGGDDPVKAALWMFGAGDGSSAITFNTSLGQGPLVRYEVADTTISYVQVVDRMQGPPAQWLPLDPVDTQGNFSTNLSVTAGAGGIGQNGVFAKLSGVRLIGYPRTYFDNGALFTGAYGSVA